MSKELAVITVRDYVNDEGMRETADMFLALYGYTPRECGEIRYNDKKVSFCIRRESCDGFEWVDHVRY